MSEPTSQMEAKNADTNRQRALEKLKAARLRLARSGATTSSAFIRNAALAAKERANKSETTTPISQPTSEATGTSSTSTSIQVNSNGKRPLDADQSTPSGPAPPSHNTQATHSNSQSSQTQHRNATQAEVRLPPINKKFINYVDYDFSKMKDPNGGFIVGDEMTVEELLEKKQQEMEALKREQRLEQPPLFLNPAEAPKCSECGSTDIDFKLYNVFGCNVCKCCREAMPEKYSLLTKTECREDYLLTDGELRDTDLFKHLEKPNPHKTTYNNMMLYMRYQVEEYSFKKWGGPEGLDAEYERRVEMQRKRKDKKLMKQMNDLRRKTKANAGYAVTEEEKTKGRHTHEWSAAISVQNADVPGTVRRRCAICGLTTEEVIM